MWRPTGLTFRHMPNGNSPLRNPLWRILLQARSVLSNWTECKEPTWTRTSAKSAWEIVQKLSSDKQQSILIHKFGNPFGIPCPSCTVLTLRRLMSRKKMSVQQFCTRRKGMICDHAMDFCMRNLRRKAEWEKNLVLILVPGSHEHLASRKFVMCAKNMGACIQHSFSEYQKYLKMGWEIGFPCSQERRKETSN